MPAANLTPRSHWQRFAWFKSFAATRWFACHEAVGSSLTIGREVGGGGKMGFLFVLGQAGAMRKGVVWGRGG